MPTMRTAGIVRSERGPSGGYRLNKDPSEITLERVVRLFQGPLAPISCATRHNPEPCPMTVGCTLARRVGRGSRRDDHASRRRDVRRPRKARGRAVARRVSHRRGACRRVDSGSWPWRPIVSTGCSSRESVAEPASGDVRELDEPATGARAGARGDGGRGGRRPRGRGSAEPRSKGTGAARRGPSAVDSCTRSPTRSSRTAQSSPSSRRGTSARRSRPSRPSSIRRSRTSATTARRSRRSPAARTRSAARSSSTR